MYALRRQDDVTVQPGPCLLNPASLAGRWVNTNAHSRGVCEFAVNNDRGDVRLQAFSTAPNAVCGWGTTKAALICGGDVRSQAGIAFTASYDFGEFQTELQGNLNLGLLVVASFNRIGAGGYYYFAREFYRRGDPASAPLSTPWNAALGRVGGDDPPEPDPDAPGLPFDGSEMFGRWLNTNPESKGIAQLHLDGDGRNGALLRVWGAQVRQPVEWDVIPAELFALGSGSRLAKAFSARYDAGGVAVALQANIKQGVLVVASFTEFTDHSGRSNYFHREFYYRA
jgi:hypothetical protein